MSLKKVHLLRIIFLCFCMAVPVANAQVVPSSADAGRVDRNKKTPTLPQAYKKFKIPKKFTLQDIPNGADKIIFKLNKLNINGNSAISVEELGKIYKPLIGKTISLTKIYTIASRIDEVYRQQGYFLSRAIVPAQEIENGIVGIKIIEGYIGNVILTESLKDSKMLLGNVPEITKYRPITSLKLESFLLKLNDLGAYDFSGKLQESKNGDAQAVTLVLYATPKKDEAMVSLDNYGSRFLGSWQVNGVYKTHFLDWHSTEFHISSTLPADELRYISFKHQMALKPGMNVEIGGSHVRARPGYTLSPNEIQSNSNDYFVKLNYSAIKQRQESLDLSVGYDSKNSNGNILKDTPLTRDRIRKLTAKISYNGFDSLSGYNVVTATATQGVDFFGASQPGDANLSRAEAVPDFSKIEIDLMRRQFLTSNVSLTGRVSGQYASGPLYSSEEYGYGGRSFGRAYDASEIAGDHGLSASVQVQYSNLPAGKSVQLSPYAFYDVGKIWNEDALIDQESAASIGFGTDITLPYGLRGVVEAAWPLTRPKDNPADGDAKGARINTQIMWNF